mgnify:CR=1 FL=1
MRKYPYSLGTEGLVHATQHDIKRINMNSLFFIKAVNLDYSQANVSRLRVRSSSSFTQYLFVSEVNFSAQQIVLPSFNIIHGDIIDIDACAQKCAWFEIYYLRVRSLIYIFHTMVIYLLSFYIYFIFIVQRILSFR